MFDLIESTLQMVGTLLLSYVFVVAGLHKLRNPLLFQKIFDDYDLLPRVASYPSVLLLTSLEIITGFSLLFSSSLLGAALAASLLILYTLAIAINLVRGKVLLDCGCSGSDRKQRLSAWLLFRNLILIFFATSLLWTGVVSSSAWLLVIPTAIFMVGLYEVGEQLLLNKSKLDNLRVNYG